MNELEASVLALIAENPKMPSKLLKKLILNLNKDLKEVALAILEGNRNNELAVEYINWVRLNRTVHK